MTPRSTTILFSNSPTKWLLFPLLALSLLQMSACGGGSSSGGNSGGGTNTGGGGNNGGGGGGTPVSVSPTSLTFTTSAAQTFSVSNGEGAITASNTCLNMAMLSGPAGDGLWTVTPDQVTASCTATFVDAKNNSATETINVQLAPVSSSMIIEMGENTDCTAAIDLLFFDATADLVWPANGQDYILNLPGEEQDSPSLSCTTGDQICYGASYFSNTDVPAYWGVGINGTEGCTDCCYACADTTVNVGLLNCNIAPNVIKSNNDKKLMMRLSGADIRH